VNIASQAAFCRALPRLDFRSNEDSSAKSPPMGGRRAPARQGLKLLRRGQGGRRASPRRTPSAESFAMPGITRRRVPEARNEASRIFYGDVPIGNNWHSAPACRSMSRRSPPRALTASGGSVTKMVFVCFIASQPVHRHDPGVSTPIGKRHQRDMHYLIRAKRARRRGRPRARY
jgi:hypothetical protein